MTACYDNLSSRQVRRLRADAGALPPRRRVVLSLVAGERLGRLTQDPAPILVTGPHCAVNQAANRSGLMSGAMLPPNSVTI
jgi:hypothetical protein